ncbi:MAG: hypothetical protein RI935_564 [Candidatus Parcubacteria bacterium]|jgi:hypothetical protein
MSLFLVPCSFYHLVLQLAVIQTGVKLFNITPLPPVGGGRKRQVEAKPVVLKADRYGARSRSPHGGLAVLRQEARLNNPARPRRRNGSRK